MANLQQENVDGRDNPWIKSGDGYDRGKMIQPTGTRYARRPV
jgi:hypothetical protein